METAVWLLAALLLLTAVPAAGIAAGRWAEHFALGHIRAQATTAHSVQAVLLEQAPAIGAPDPYTTIQVVWVPARWMAPRGPARTGDVLAPAGARKGSTVQTWVDEPGRLAPAPPGRGQVDGDVFLAVTLAMMAVAFAVLGAGTLAHRTLQHRRMSAWDAEWRTVAPLWTGPRT